MKKLILTIVLAIYFLGTINSYSVMANSTFTDIESSPMKFYIEKLANEKIISGYNDGTFRPKQKVTRAQYAKMLALAMELPLDATYAKSFTDLADWAKPYVGALVKADISRGKTKTVFGANDYITRQEMAVMFVRAMGLEEYILLLEFQDSFADSNKISSWAKPHVLFLKDIGFAEGNGDYYFPQEASTREAFAKLTYRMTFEEHKYFERALNRIILEFYEDINQVTYLGDLMLKINYSDGSSEEFEVEDILNDIYWHYHYYSLEGLNGYDWMQMNSAEKKELIMFILNYWDSDYSNYILKKSKETAYSLLLARLNNLYLPEHNRYQEFLKEITWAAVDTFTIEYVGE